MPGQTVSVAIVGGGTAGWITACRLAAGAAQHAVPRDIVVVESPDIPTIGVGEGTWPSMRATLQAIGIAESDVMRECDASFKQGTRFRGWRAGADDTYLHPFSLPAEYASLNLADAWLTFGAAQSFAHCVTPQAAVIEAGLAPRQAGMPEYAFALNYGYHFDAARFGALLRRHAVGNLGVRHRLANVVGVEARPDGDIAALVLDDGTRAEADLFVDCSGQHALLLGGHYGVPLSSAQDCLLNDRAIAAQVPDTAPLHSVTQATATGCGWIWDIGLPARRGTGHVYSSAHASDDDAEAALLSYLQSTTPGLDADGIAFRRISFEPGHRETFWVRNCVAVGLSAGFVEPLEASALALIEQSATMLDGYFPPHRAAMNGAARRFNEKMRYHWERVIEFLKLHYVLSRRDEPYWRDNRDASTVPAALAEKLELWRWHAPWHDDAPRVDELFPSASYQYVLYGMGFRPDAATARSYAPDELARIDAVLHDVREKSSRLRRALPGNRALIDATLALRGVA